MAHSANDSDSTERQRARMTLACAAHDAADLAELLDALDLREDPPPPTDTAAQAQAKARARESSYRARH